MRKHQHGGFWSDSNLNRRTLLKAGAAFGASLPLHQLWAGASFAEEIATELRWLEYSHMEKPFFTEPFEQETKIKLIPGAISNDDTTLATLKAGGTKDWDVFHMGDMKNHPILVKDKLVQPIDYSKIPNTGGILPVFQAFIDKRLKGPDGQIYGMPNRWGVDTLGYRTDKMDAPTSMKVLFNDKYSGRIAMPDYALYSVIYGAQYLDYPREDYYRLSNSQLAEIKKVLLAQKKILKAYWLSDADLINMVSSGEVWVAGATWAGTVATMNENNVPFQRVVPKEPGFGFINIAYVSIDSPPPSVAAANKFLNYIIGPVMGQRIGEQGRYATVTTLGQDGLSPAIKQQVFLTYVNKLDTLVEFMVSPTDPETGALNYDKWVTMWNEVKAS
jgi:spermidine/putrescine transport system substrate-binding protein